MFSQAHFMEIANELYKYRGDDFLCDTVLIASDRVLKAHSVLLAAVSPVFKSAFESNGGPGMYHINLPDFNSTTLEIALNFIYTGKLLLPSKYTEPGELSKLFASLQDLGLELKTLNGCEMRFQGSVS